MFVIASEIINNSLGAGGGGGNSKQKFVKCYEITFPNLLHGSDFNFLCFLFLNY